MTTFRRPSLTGTRFCIPSRLHLAILLLCLPGSGLAQVSRAPAFSKSAKSWAVSAQPARLVNGGPVAFRVKPPVALKSLSGEWLGHTVDFMFDAPTKAWWAIAGVSLNTKRGSYALMLKGATNRDKDVSFERRFAVMAGKYRSIAVQVAKKYTEPDPEQLRKIAADKTIKQKTFEQVTPEREWAGSFRAPVQAPVSDVFGTRRTFNGKVQSVHQGLDFAAPAGATISAVNSGTVLLARPLYFEGNCVVLDHGQGLLTLYMHMSQFEVHEGDHVRRGQALGLVGGTGRATGPHLHLAVRWQGEYLDPALLLGLRLP
jgi:murein DD-endopeptidase MepM/ murein hydrolase activator NlpD